MGTKKKIIQTLGTAACAVAITVPLAMPANASGTYFRGSNGSVMGVVIIQNGRPILDNCSWRFGGRLIYQSPDCKIVAASATRLKNGKWRYNWFAVKAPNGRQVIAK